MFSRLLAAVLIPAALLLLTCRTVAEPKDDPRGNEFFEKKIRPVLLEHCASCHSATAKKVKGGLLLDSRGDMLKGGDSGPAIVPGKPDQSRLIEAVHYTNVDMQMPPKAKLSPAVIADLVEWVKIGAPWPGPSKATVVKESFDLQGRKKSHWAWQPLAKIAPPAVKDTRWARTDIDRFLLARLENKGLRPAPSADRRTLLRRLTFDLTGLPPTVAEIEAFETDTRPRAIDRVVDRLLASPRYGENWGRHWLDLVRYAETRGHEFDPPIPNAYQYRDYLIRALNADVRYDQLVTEHIAGDLLSSPRLHPREGFNESILGTGFWFLGEEVHSPVDIRADQADRFDNRIDVMAKTFLGLTVSCARCHDHKFDAISARDYYALYGYLSSSHYRLVRFDSLEHNKKVAQELWQTRRRHTAEIERTLGADLSSAPGTTRAYLLAAREALVGTTVVKAEADEFVFEDFESGTYANWEVTGTAFGKSPQTLATTPAYQGKINAVGKYFVNSHNNRSGESVGQGDAHTGKMKSRTFPIRHDSITLLVGGGAHAGKTCVNLVVDGKVARTATGRNDNQMYPVRWDVRRLHGKKAHIEIIDDHTGGWGNIGVDQIVFSGIPRSAEDTPSRIVEVARVHHLDAKRLARWVSAVRAARTDPRDPLHAWARFSSNPTGKAPVVSLATEVVLDYRTAPAGAWLPDDVTFGPGPVRAGSLQVAGTLEKPTLSVAERSAAPFDPFWRGLKVTGNAANDPGRLGQQMRAGRTLSTPAFKLTTGKLHYLLRGSGMVYAAVGSHVMIEGPLHARLVQSFGPSAGQFRWIAHDLSTYQGQNVHLEFSANDTADLAIAMVVQGAAPPVETPIASLARLSGGTHDAPALAAGYDRLFRQVAGQLRAGRMADSADASGQARLANWMLRNTDLFTSDATWTRPAAELLRDEARLAGKVQRESRLAPAMQDGTGVDEYVFLRGAHRAVGPTVPRRFLEALGGGDKGSSEPGSGRLALAREMLDTDKNPLIARVIVNRVWHHLFGRGIVASVDDFGVMGQPPTHPELLDHLARQFVADGWSIKRLIRSLVLTRAYQMSSRSASAEQKALADKVDPDNLLLHRARIRRLQGEAIRDALLAISGRLDDRMFGPSINIHLTDFQQGRGRPASGPLDGDGRRSVYLAVKRNFLSSLLLAFDTPTPFSTVGRRTVSNVPAQSLILMNDPFVHQQTRLWADRVRKQPGEDVAKIRRMYLAAFGRPPRQAEVAACRNYLDEWGGWAELAHALVNVKEFIYLP